MRYPLGTLVLLVGRCAIASAAATCIACQQQDDRYQSLSRDCVSWTANAWQPTTPSTVPAQSEIACAGHVPRASLEEMLQH
jgi:hypothetical protein